MKIKRLLSFLLVFIICLSITACTDNSAVNSDITTTTAATTTVTTTAAENSTDETSTLTQSTTQLTSTQLTTSVVTTAKTTVNKTTAAPTTTKKQQTVAGSSPLLYKVSDGKGNIAWLFGSIHIGKESFYPLPDYVTDAFNKSDSLAVEFDIIAYGEDIDQQVEALSKQIYLDNTTIKDHISTETYNEAVKILKDNDLYDIFIDYYCPAVWSDLINSLTYEKHNINFEYGIDRYLINEAYKQKKEVLDVESAVFQAAMMANFSDPLQEMLLQASIMDYQDDTDYIKKSNDFMMNMWAKGNETLFADYLNEIPEFEDANEEKLYQEYTKALVTDRNIKMADYAENALKSGKEVFICVGAAHVVGKGAMVELLKQRGYKVELVK